jgi:hypothetical protein
LNALRHGLSSPVAPDFVGRRYPQLIELLVREEGLEEGSAHELSRKIFEYERSEAHVLRELASALDDFPALAAPSGPVHNAGPKSPPKSEPKVEPKVERAAQAPEVHDPLTDLRLALQMAPAPRRPRSARGLSADLSQEREVLALARAAAKAILGHDQRRREELRASEDRYLKRASNQLIKAIHLLCLGRIKSK